MCKSLCFSLLLLFLIFQNLAYLNMFSWCKWRISNGQRRFLFTTSFSWYLVHSPGSKETYIKNISNQPVLDSPLIHMMPFHLQIQWDFHRSGKNHTCYDTQHHPSSICNCKPTSVLILERKDIGMKENPEITVQFYFKWLYVLLYLYYKCKTLAIDGQDGNGLQLEKTGPSFSTLTPVCYYVIEHMNNHLYVSWFPPAVVRH